MNAVDLFCGAGGWSHGWREATGCEPVIAVNHDPHAVHLHRLNHPATEHHLKDVWEVDPQAAIAGRRVDWLHGSPDCTHFSRARGGKPREQKIRVLAWVLVDWVRVARPRVLSLENVLEFTTWGPLDDTGHPIKERAGETFGEFVTALQQLGYVVDWRVLCAADFGAPTIRRRLFLIARRDGQPIRWPAPTHADPNKRDLWSAGLQPWRTAAECIDWSLPCPSIFDRKRPLAPATCRRIAAGIVRFVLQGKPFIVTCNHGKEGFRGQGIDEPMKTVTASRDANGLVLPTLIQTGYGERQGQAPRSLDLLAPLGTVVAGGAKHGLVAAFLQQNFTGMVGKPLRVPVPTITARDHHSLVEAHLSGDRAKQVAAFLTSYYGSGGTSSDLRKPMPTVVTKDRHGLVLCRYFGESYAIADIGMRMLTPRELARAQGFPDSYVLEGTKTQQIARIGNSVVPQVAEAIVRANLGLKAAVA